MAQRQAYGQLMDLNPAQSRQTTMYRRNGKLQSCNPCRKSKLACDHILPVCGRCAKRKRGGDSCVYDPSPVTKRRATATSSALTPSTDTLTSPSTVFQSVELRRHFPPLTPNLTEAVSEAPVAVTRAASAPPLDHYCKDSPATRGNPGFLGSTSYSSIFTEDLGSLGVVAVDIEANQTQSYSIPSDRIARGCQVLGLLKDSFMINLFVSRWFQAAEGCGNIIIEPMMKTWLKLLWRDNGTVLKEQDPANIQRLCKAIWVNTQTPLIFDGTTSPQQWMSLSSGHNIRWEVVGLICAIVGMCARSIMASDPLFKECSVSRETLPKKMNEAAEVCISFCRELEALDDLLIWLLMENYPLTSAIRGEGSYIAYQQSGELNNALIAKGLHQEINADARTPFFLAEMRKRCFIQAFGNDVSIASFLGRPPRLSYRHCTLDPHLDLSDHEVILEGAQLQKALDGLDSNGWNRVQKLTRATWMRVWVGFAPRREDILDLSLGSYSKEEILRRAAEIHELSEARWTLLPQHLRECRDQPSMPKYSPIDTLYRNVIRQGYLANELLLQRVLVRKTGAGIEKLIKTARAIFKDIMLITTRLDMTKDFQTDMTYLLAAHGLRSAAIIAVELLRQEQQPVYNEQLPRSETIQDLSIFAARLGNVEESDGTYAICEQGRKVITRILDKILAPPQQDIAQMNFQQDQLLGIQPLDIEGDGGVGLGPPLNLENDNDFMRWLESTSMDWGRGWTL